MLPARRPLSLVLFFCLLILLTVGVTMLSVRLMSPHGWQAHDKAHGHEWLQNELALTDAEREAIDQFEAPYRTERARLQAEFDQKVQAIADLLESRDAFGPDVVHAIHDLHIVHGELQELSIRHYFDMLSVLPPEKQEQLRKLAVAALSTPQ